MKKPKYWFQRAKRGYSDQDAWNGDMYLASQIAAIMKWKMEKGIGVSPRYGGEEESIDILVKRRDEDYEKHFAIFQEYAEKGPAFDQEWKSEFGGVLDGELNDSLQWLVEHFTELWD
jgi:hypothetical protein